MKVQSKLMISNVVALLAVNMLAPCYAAIQPDNVNVRLGQIESQLNTSRNRESELLQEVSKIIESNPSNGKAHFLAGRILERTGFSTLAAQEFEKAEKLSPGTADAMLESFLLKLEQDDPQAAFDYIGYIAKRFPNDPSLALTRALLMESKGKTELAEVFIDKALDGKDKRLGIATAVGQIRLRQGKLAEALELAKYDLRKNPDYFRANYLAGQACTRMKHYKEAAGYYKVAYAQNPVDDRFVQEYAADLYRAGMYVEALEPAITYLALATKGDVMRKAKYQLQLLMKRTTDDQIIAAVRQVDRKLDRSIYQGRLHLALGDVFDSVGKRALAEECYARGIQQFPEMGRPYYRLAKDLEKDRNYEQAKDLYEKAYSLDPNDFQVAAGYVRFGMRYVNRKNDIAWQFKDLLHGK